MEQYLEEFKRNVVSVDPQKKYCVYALIDRGEIVYIGKSEQLESRISTHLQDKIFNQYSYIVCKNRLEKDWLETYLILKLQPKLNKTVPQNGFVSLQNVRSVIRALGEDYRYNPKYYVPKLKKAAEEIDIKIYNHSGKSLIELKDQMRLINYVLREGESDLVDI